MASSRPPVIPINPVLYRPKVGELISNVFEGSQPVYSRDPASPVTGQDTYKYGLAALHPNIAQPLRLKVSGPFWVPWEIIPKNDYTQYPGFQHLDEAIIRSVLSQLERLENEDFTNILRALTYDAMVFGFTVAEMNWGRRGTDGHQNVRSIKVHPPWQFDLYWNQVFDLEKLYYRMAGQWISGEDLDYFVIAPWPYLAHGNWYGRSHIIPVYNDVRLIEVLEQAQAEGVRAVSIKALMLFYRAKNLSKTQLDNLKSALFGLDAGALIPIPASTGPDGNLIPEYDVKVLEDRASAPGMALISDILERLYKRVTRNMDLPDDLGFTTTTVGSLAKSREEGNLYMQEIVSTQEWIEAFVNRQIIPKLVRFNFPSALYGTYQLPQFKFQVVEENFVESLATPMLALYSAGLITKDEARTALGYEAGDDAAPDPDAPDVQNGGETPIEAADNAEFAKVGRRSTGEGAQKFLWSASIDEESCPDCIERNGTSATRAEWERRGLPRGLNASGNPATQCRDNCRCKLEATI